MLFNSFLFLLFFPAVCIVYFMLPHKARWLFLLAASYYFYACWSVEYLALIITSTIITFFSGILIGATHKKEHYDDKQKKREKRLWVALSLITNLGILFFFKYANFALDTAGWLLSFKPEHVDILLPVGISFYTFQALSYTMDIYYGRIETEKHIGKYALFVSFFPQLVAGPIEKANHLLPQIHTVKQFKYEDVRSGLILMAVGFFKKIVIADRLAVFVDGVYGDLEAAPGIAILWAIIFFAFQLYLDFSAYSDIAIGSARIMGFDICRNFNRPYWATSFSDFWKRWHISLSSWFKEYLYIPLGGNKKGQAKMLMYVMIVFLVSGLWHGASWNFVFWGGLNGLLLIGLDRIITPKKLTPLNRIRNALIIFTSWAITLIFFRAETFGDALMVFERFGLSGEGLYKYGLLQTEFNLALGLIAGLWVIEYIQEKKDLFAFLGKRALPIRWAAYIVIVVSIILLGAYGEGFSDNSFIYFQF